VQKVGGDGTRITSTNTTSVDATVTDGAIEGSVAVALNQTCKGSSCDSSQNVKCTATFEFSGVEIEHDSLAIGADQPAPSN
jgi:hypothetical protein